MTGALRFGRKEEPIFAVISALLFLGFYLMCAGKLAGEELLAGGVAAVSAALLLHKIRKRRRTPLVFKRQWLWPFIFLPTAVLWETVLLAAALIPWRAEKKKNGRFIFYYNKTLAGNSPEQSARKAVASYGVCFSPNSYLVNFEDGKAVLHQLAGRKLSKSDKAFLEIK